MWNLLKSEFNYSNYTMIITFSFVLVISFVFLIWGGSELENSVPAYQTVLIAAFLVPWMFRLMQLQKERKDRIHMLLPMSLRIIAITRVFVLILYWLALLVVYITCTFIVQGFSQAQSFLWFMVSLTGFVLTINAVPLVQRDMNSIVMHKYQRLFIFLVWTVIFVSFYLVFYFLLIPLKSIGLFAEQKAQFHERVSSGAYSLVFLCIGLILSCLSVFLFKRRKVYIE